MLDHCVSCLVTKRFGNTTRLFSFFVGVIIGFWVFISVPEQRRGLEATWKKPSDPVQRRQRADQ